MDIRIKVPLSISEGSLRNELCCFGNDVVVDLVGIRISSQTDLQVHKTYGTLKLKVL
jgi:hypothetical protein